MHMKSAMKMARRGCNQDIGVRTSRLVTDLRWVTARGSGKDKIP